MRGGRPTATASTRCAARLPGDATGMPARERELLALLAATASPDLRDRLAEAMASG